MFISANGRCLGSGRAPGLAGCLSTLMLCTSVELAIKCFTVAFVGTNLGLSGRILNQSPRQSSTECTPEVSITGKPSKLVLGCC